MLSILRRICISLAKSDAMLRLILNLPHGPEPGKVMPCTVELMSEITLFSVNNFESTVQNSNSNSKLRFKIEIVHPEFEMKFRVRFRIQIQIQDSKCRFTFQRSRSSSCTSWYMTTSSTLHFAPISSWDSQVNIAVHNNPWTGSCRDCRVPGLLTRIYITRQQINALQFRWSDGRYKSCGTELESQSCRWTHLML